MVHRNKRVLQTTPSIDDLEDQKQMKHEHVEQIDLASNEDEAAAQIAAEHKKRLLWKLDLRIMPVLISLYCMFHLNVSYGWSHAHALHSAVVH